MRNLSKVRACLVTRFFCLFFQDFERVRKNEKKRNIDVRAKRQLAASIRIKPATLQCTG